MILKPYGMCMNKVWLVGIGGFIGSISRYLLGGYLNRFSQNSSLPYETLVINVVGCFLLGILAGLAEFRGVFSPEIRVFFFIGILGGFTTFSTFSFETIQLIRDNQIGWAMINIMLQVFLGLAGTWTGLSLSRMT